jgi:hypothetical protein
MISSRLALDFGYSSKKTVLPTSSFSCRQILSGFLSNGCGGYVKLFIFSLTTLLLDLSCFTTDFTRLQSTSSCTTGLSRMMFPTMWGYISGSPLDSLSSSCGGCVNTHWVGDCFNRKNQINISKK